MNILFYTIAGKRSRDIESQAIHFAKSGHCIFLLTQTPWSELHVIFESQGFTARAQVIQSRFYPLLLLKHIWYLRSFCKHHKIDLVYSHLDPCNLIAAFTEFISPTRFVVTRHHADALLYEATAKSRWMSRLIYRVATNIIVVSENSRAFMVNNEGIDHKKIHVIPLSFDFSLYDLPKKEKVEEIRANYPASLLLITIGRFSTLKRIDKIIEVVKTLTEERVDVKLIIIGHGPEEIRLKEQVSEYSLTDRVFMLGFIHDVLPYLAAADIYVHLSKSEASCTTVKEAALVCKPVVVCSDVGDFNEYIQSSVNGWKVNKNYPVKETVNLLKTANKQSGVLKRMGQKNNEIVLKHFDIRDKLPLYNNFHKS
jgi:glycosyltransferase involved in cell wall biosynthesis